jgi:hypothetical protein
VSNNNLVLNNNIGVKYIKMDTSTKSLPNLVKDIIFFYVKYYYEKYLTDNSLTKMSDEDIDKFISIYYGEKQQDLKDYIRNSLKKNQGSEYSSIATENILLELFNDTDMAKERIRLEIQDFQAGK